MEQDVVVKSKAPARNSETRKTFRIRQHQNHQLIVVFQIRPQQSYLRIVMFQLSFKAVVKPKRLIVVCISQRWQQGVQRRTRQSIETPPACERTNKGYEEGQARSRASDRTNEGYEEGQARSRASDHKHPASPKVRAVDEDGKKVRQEDRRNKGAARALLGKVKTSTINGERDDIPRPDNFEADGPSGGKTKPNAYQTPS